jgi:hypothetical protein
MMARRALLLANVVYLIVWAGAAVFTYRVFGGGPVVFLSLMLVLPYIMAVHAWFRRKVVRGRDLGYLSAVAILALGTAAVAIWKGYDEGTDRQHSKDLQFAELARALQSDPAFQNVDFSITHLKGRYRIHGSVASQADLERLKSVAGHYDFLFYMRDVTVAGTSKRGNGE